MHATPAETIVHVVGARPNFMKAAPVVHALRRFGADQRIVHTGQHYDAGMSDVFLEELEVRPDLNLGVGSGSHAEQTAAVMMRFDEALPTLAPRLVVVYGDVNSTIAAALVAAKRSIPVAHVEAGLRSFDNRMPEEINRRLTDQLSEILFVTAPEGMANLSREGIPSSRMHYVGNPMIDTLLSHRQHFDADAARARHELRGPYALVTVHRPSNVDEPEAAHHIVRMLEGLSVLADIVLPLHPRGRAMLERQGLRSSERIRITEPLGYIGFMSLVQGAAIVISDSGGIQEETTVLEIPCLTIRDNTERPITITHGTNRLARPDLVPELAREVLEGRWVPPVARPPLWDGNAGERIAGILTGFDEPSPIR